MFTVDVVRAPELGNASFVVADPERGAGMVIDPMRDIERYLEIAKAKNIKLTHALDTHLHNDYVSGCRELAAEAGTNIDELAPNQEMKVGDLSIRALHTPGHTPEHKSYVLTEAGRPKVLFSGGAVMLGAIARTDLFGPHLAVHLALEALSTLQVRLRGLPDDIAVY
ncbi:MAG: MBL fold metallo-hydrolase, partial [Chloroflexi bacterium]